MKTSTKTLVVLAITALVLPLVLASAAMAGDLCDRNPDHPKCQATTTTTTTIPAEHPDGATCVETNDGFVDFVETDGFPTISLAEGEAACIDWTTTFESDWLITVEANPRARVTMSVRDSHPGDFCWRSERGEFDDGSALIPALPASTIDACGTAYTDSDAAFVLTVSVSGKSSPVTLTITPAG